MSRMKELQMVWIAVSDGLKGIPESLEAAYPQAASKLI
jgi:transposase-like protein